MNPAAVRLPPGFPAFGRVFVVGGDGKLYSRDITAASATQGDWQRYDPPGGQVWASSPFVTVAGSSLLVFLTDVDGFVNQLTLDAAGGVEWFTLTPNNQSFKAVSRPFAQPIALTTDAKVFVFALEEGTDILKLFECDTTTVINGEFEWDDLGRPATNDGIAARPDAHAPSGYIENTGRSNDIEGKHIFLRGADNRLYERMDDTAGGDPRWEDRTRPGDPELRDSPTVDIAVSGPITTLRVLSASGRNSVVVWEFEITRGDIPEDPERRAALLNEALASSVDNDYQRQTLN
ncbi:MAG: hypothetical protein M3461_02435 [Pseudomonadota bacterium]|nr:hypothetical protein [Pseudomonadota bacterium]